MQPWMVGTELLKWPRSGLSSGLSHPCGSVGDLLWHDGAMLKRCPVSGSAVASGADIETCAAGTATADLVTACAVSADAATGAVSAVGAGSTVVAACTTVATCAADTGVACADAVADHAAGAANAVGAVVVVGAGVAGKAAGTAVQLLVQLCCGYSSWCYWCSGSWECSLRCLYSRCGLCSYCCGHEWASKLGTMAVSRHAVDDYWMVMSRQVHIRTGGRAEFRVIVQVTWVDIANGRDHDVACCWHSHGSLDTGVKLQGLLVS
jgi:hypothetical protein